MDLAARVTMKYPWLSTEEATELVEMATALFYGLRYPCEPNASPETHPINSFMDKRNVLWICDEIAQRNGFNSSIGYRENGISFTFDGAWLSDRLVNAIKPIIGVI